MIVTGLEFRRFDSLIERGQPKEIVDKYCDVLVSIRSAQVLTNCKICPKQHEKTSTLKQVRVMTSQRHVTTASTNEESLTNICCDSRDYVRK